MPRTLLLTTGTSIANNTESLREFHGKSTAWNDDPGALAGQITERLKGFDLTSEVGRAGASAELNILQRLPVHPEDEVVLFSTDTADGRCCSEALANVIKTVFGVRAQVERIQGLQVRDRDKLCKVGLTNLTRRLIYYLSDPQRRYGGGCILCPNGGFKGIVPFVTILGMIYRAPVVYVFEFAQTVIRLPPLPIGFASDLLERALPALRWAARENMFSPDGFFRLIPGYHEGERDLFESFLELVPESGGSTWAGLSPLALALAEQETANDARLRLSKSARNALAELGGAERRHIAAHLHKLTSPLWRSQHLDTKYTNDLEFYPRGHHPWRFAGFVDGGIFHLCWFARHDEYERLLRLPSSQRAAFDKAAFDDFTLEVEEVPSAVLEDQNQNYTWQELLQQRNQALAEVKDLRDQAMRLRTETKKLRIEKDRALARLQELEQKAKKQKQATNGRESASKKDLIGKTLDARCEGPRGKCFYFTAIEHPKMPQILVPAVEMADIAPGLVIRISVTGFDGNYYQAHREEQHR